MNSHIPWLKVAKYYAAIILVDAPGHFSSLLWRDSNNVQLNMFLILKLIEYKSNKQKIWKENRNRNAR